MNFSSLVFLKKIRDNKFLYKVGYLFNVSEKDKFWRNQIKNLNLSDDFVEQIDDNNINIKSLKNNYDIVSTYSRSNSFKIKCLKCKKKNTDNSTVIQYFNNNDWEDELLKYVLEHS